MSKKLFTLIKSLTANEKGYFKKASTFQKAKGTNTYIKLFEVVEGMKTYNPAILENAFNNKKSSKDISAYTNYLFQQILDTLRIYNSGKKIDSKIWHLLEDADLLYNRQLFAESKNFLAKARHEAEVHERYLMLLEVSNREEQLFLGPFIAKYSEEKIFRMHDERSEATEKLKNYFHYRWLHNRLVSIQHKTGEQVWTEVELKKLKSIIKHPLLQREKMATSLMSQSNYYYIHSFYNYIKPNRNLQKSIEASLKRMKLRDANLKWASSDISTYLIIIQNLHILFMHSLDVENYDELIDSLQKMPERFGKKISPEEDEKRKAYLNSAILRRSFLIADFDTCFNLISGHEQEWELLQEKLGQGDLMVFYNNMQSLFFAVQEYKKALQWNNKLLNEMKKEINPELYTVAIIWDIIIHFELGNLDLTRTLLKRADNKANNEIRKNSFGKLFLATMDEILKAKSAVAMKIAFGVFRKELSSLKQEATNISKLDYISYMAWIDSHIEQVSFTEAYKKHLQHR